MKLCKTSHFLFLTVLLLTSCGLKPHGADSPKELLYTASSAIEKQDKAGFKKCFYWTSLEEEAAVESRVKLYFKSNDYKKFMKSGEKKLGFEFYESLGASIIWLRVLSEGIPYRDLAEKGEYKIVGDTATVSLKREDEFIHSLVIITMVNVNDKWFFTGPDEVETKTAKDFEVYFEKMQEALESSNNVYEFRLHLKKVICEWEKNNDHSLKFVKEIQQN